jgi:hypothetical protein
MVTSYLSARVTTLPFTDMTGLVKTSDFKIAVTPGSSFVDSFRLSRCLSYQGVKTLCSPLRSSS